MRNKISILIIALAIAFTAFAQPGWIPSSQNPVPNKPNQLVNDWSDLLSPSEEQHLENKLVALSDSTSNQIAILTINELNEYDIAQLSFKIGDAWGIGGPSQDNGLLILVSKNEREVFIATGKGMEGPVPDITAKRIIENIMIPQFKEGDYFAGLNQATDAITKLTAGEFVDELADKKSGGSSFPGIGLIIFILLIFLFMGNNRRRGGGFINRGGWHPRPWIWGGGGFGGGGGGGFGGFGGGGFGGGGAGGRW